MGCCCEKERRSSARHTLLPEDPDGSEEFVLGDDGVPADEDHNAVLVWTRADTGWVPHYLSRDGLSTWYQVFDEYFESPPTVWILLATMVPTLTLAEFLTRATEYTRAPDGSYNVPDTSLSGKGQQIYVYIPPADEGGPA